MKKNKVKVLFVCMGNICRSPTAHGVFQYLVEQENLTDYIEIDSAGTHSYHVGSQPDHRAQQTAVGKGIDLSYIRSRQVNNNDFAYYDYILAMDNNNYELLEESCPQEFTHKLALFLNYAPDYVSKEVPDPYYGGVNGFNTVFDMVDSASKGLLAEIKKQT